MSAPGPVSCSRDAFLGCPTPPAWLAAVPDNLDVLLIDHANCEKKAAGAALAALYRYNQHDTLLVRLSRLAREELRHFEQVLAALRERGIAYRQVSASRYAAGLRRHARTAEPGRLVDLLLIGALVEARSCERFELLAPLLQRIDAPLAALYARLARSEQRHFEVYLALAEDVAAAGEIEQRTAALRQVENSLVSEPDDEFRSGAPTAPSR